LLALSGKMTLRLKAAVLREAVKPDQPATIVLKIDGREIDRFTSSSGEFERVADVENPPPNVWRRLTIETDRAVVPASIGLNDDARELGLQVFSLEWLSAPDAPKSVYGLEDFVAGGWYSAERAWRWTGAEAFLKLPGIWTPGRLDLRMDVPEGPNGRRARVRLEINGRLIDAFDPPDGVFSRSYDVAPEIHGGTEALLRITTDQLVPAPLARNLGVRVYSASWAPIEIVPETPFP